MPGHPLDLFIGRLTRAAPGPLHRPLTRLARGDRLGAAAELRRVAGRGDERALALGLARLATHLAHLALPDGGARQLVHVQASLPELQADDATLAEAAGTASASARSALDLVAAALQLLQVQAMLPPNATVPPGQLPLLLGLLGSASARLDDQVAALDDGLGAGLGAGRAEVAVAAGCWQADVLRRAGQLDAATQRWEQARSPATGPLAAALDLARGDWAAAPLSSPVAWNCSLQPVFTLDGTIGGLELLEGAVGVDPASAASWYARAESGGADPADLGLRRAWLAQVAGDTGGALALTRRAGREYAARHHLVGAAVAANQATLALLAAGHVPADLATAAEVGDWASAHAGPATAWGLSQLCSRVSRGWRTSGYAVEPALGALDLAAALLPDPAQRTRCDLDRAQALAAVGASRAARLLLEQSLAGSPPASPAQVLQHGLVLLQLYQLGAAERDPAVMAEASGRFHAAGGPASVLGPLLPAPDSDAQVLAYQALRLESSGDQAGAARLLDEAAELAGSAGGDQQLAMVTVLAARHDYAAAADVANAAHHAAAAALAAGDLGLPPALLPPGFAEQNARLERRRLAYRSFSALVRLRDPARAAPLLAELEQQGAGQAWWADVATEWEAQLSLGLLREQQGRLSEAAAAYQAGIAVAEARRASVSGDELRAALGGEVVTADLYRAASRVALRRGDAGAGFELAVRGQSRALVDLVSSAAAGRVPADAVAAWRGANAERERAGRQLLAALAAGADPATTSRQRAEQDRAQEAVTTAERALAAADPSFWRLVNPPAAPAGVAEIAAALVPGQVLLQLLVEAGDVLAWVVTPDGVAASSLARDQWQLAGWASRLRSAWSAGESVDAEPLAAALLAPVGDVLRVANRVVVVASGPTVGLPFHALPFQGAPFGAQRVVTYLPSAALLPALRAAAPIVTSPALVVGDPAAMAVQDPVTGRLVPAGGLAGARVEARYVARLVPGARCLIGADATEQAVRAALPEARLVHLATHGYLDADVPQRSAVLLADGAALDVAELAGMRLAADLVVLSACHSAGGEPAGGDELMGLARSLLAGGARRVVVTCGTSTTSPRHWSWAGSASSSSVAPNPHRRCPGPRPG